MTDPEALHTAARRYCAEHADAWRVKYGEIAKRNERPATSGLLKKLGLTVGRTSDEGNRTFPRYKILDAILIEIERRIGSDFASLDDLRVWLVACAGAAYHEETREPDLRLSSIQETFMPESQERIRALGPKAKIVVEQSSEKKREVQHQAMKEERDSFTSYLNCLSSEELGAVARLSYRRTLSESESERLWALLGTRWGVDGHWYPHDRSSDSEPPPDTTAFQAEPFFDRRLVESLQKLIRRQGRARVYELREGRAVEYELDVDILRPWYNFNEGFWLDDSADWIVYASYEGSVTVGGAHLLPALQETWSNWSEYLYSDSEPGIERAVGPGVRSTSVRVAPPPGWEPPSDG